MINLPRKESETGMFAPVWRKFNQLIDCLREITPTDSRNLRITRTVNGTLYVGEEGGGDGGSAVQLFRLKEIGADWLRCRKWSGNGTLASDGTTDIYIARDPELQRTRLDGLTIAYSSDGDAFNASFAYSSNTKRVKTVGTTAETQVIIPYYIIDSAETSNRSSIIIAAKVKNSTGVTDGNNRPVKWMELTQRAWAKLET